HVLGRRGGVPGRWAHRGPDRSAGRAGIAAHQPGTGTVSTALRERPADPAPAAGIGNGGVPARRAVTRWAWRMFRREWRQQLLVLGPITGAGAATIIGPAVAPNTPPAAGAGVGPPPNT